LTDFFRWNPEKQNSKHSTELRGHAALIEKVAFNPTRDGELCSVSSDGVVKFWDVRTKAVINEIKGLGEAFTLAWSPDGESLLVGNKVCVPFSKAGARNALSSPSKMDSLAVLSTAN
jgi:WD40 repeat protein